MRRRRFRSSGIDGHGSGNGLRGVRNIFIYALITSVFFIFFSPEIRAGEPVEIMAGEILVKFKEGTSEEQIKLFVQKYKLSEFGSDPTIQVHFYHSSEDDVTQKVSELSQEKIVKYAQANYVKKKNGIPNDLYYSQQWHLPHIGMPSAWDDFTGTQVIKVAVLDSGVNEALSDLASVIDSEWEYDFDNYDNNAEDVDGHGTLVSGIIGATANNSIGVAGISPKVKIVPLKADVANTTSVVRAMTRAHESGSKILNCSYGGNVYEPAEEEKISWLNVRGVLVVCSAGNAGTNNDTRRHYPCGYDLPNIISVANSTPSSVLHSSSNYGATTVDISAPGTSIFSTLGVGEDYREEIRNYSFSFSGESWQGFNSFAGGLSGFFWDFREGAWVTDYFIATGLYAANSSFYVESPLIDCRGYSNIQLLSTFSGVVGFGDQLGIYSGTSGWGNKVQAGSLVSGLVNGTYTRFLTPMENSFGRIWYWLTSDMSGNGYMEINNVEVSGIPIYFSESGTSFAAPVVTGVAAMLMSQNPNLTHLQVKDIILQTAQKVSALNGKVVCGGIVDAAAALREAKARVVVTPVITSSTSASATVGTAFTYSITASGAPTSYSASSLPPGLSVNTSTGAISGTPTSAGTFTSSISGSNIAGTGSASLRITVNPVAPPPPTGLVITSDVSPASITLNTPFSHQITASGSPTSFGAIRLPTGLKLNAKTGLISGKPTKAGVFSATLQALKRGSTTATATKVFTVVQVPTFSYAARINAQRNKNVNVRPKVVGSPAPSFSVVSGSLPAELSLNASTAAITGKPTTAGSYAFTVRGSNSAGNSDRSTTIVVK